MLAATGSADAQQEGWNQESWDCCETRSTSLFLTNPTWFFICLLSISTVSKTTSHYRHVGIKDQPGLIASSRPAWNTYGDHVSKDKWINSSIYQSWLIKGKRFAKHNMISLLVPIPDSHASCLVRGHGRTSRGRHPNSLGLGGRPRGEEGLDSCCSSVSRSHPFPKPCFLNVLFGHGTFLQITMGYLGLENNSGYSGAGSSGTMSPLSLT